MKNFFVVLVSCVGLIAVVYFCGPRLEKHPVNRDLPIINADINNIEDYVRNKENAYDIKPNNESAIVWADSVSVPTDYVLLYLHGFSASRREGYPVTRDFIARYKTNAYLPRLYGHGLNGDNVLEDMTPDALYNSAKEALAIVHALGRKVIIMATSNGCTLSLMLAADFPDMVDALILYSPNIEINNPFAPLLSGPWGLQLTRLVHGGENFISEDNENSEFWYKKYRLEAQVYLQQLLDMHMQKEEFNKVHQPAFMGYYYMDDEHQDETIKVSAALRMFSQLGTADSLKVSCAFADATDHVIACDLTSGAVDAVRDSTFSFVDRFILKP